ncbi:MAG TPA: aminopeptidase P family protein [Bacteroidales bacterium]|jgi:Xaa-Pro aminopeptidase|nr:aminopeptidase P family protein [Bacteroidales bacterium]HOC05333.1 aminopeptidase P family protein [Bacteroidales bacterium]HOH15455.1 aminopeptidase P family protein [Bacteroidales bacterium]HPX54316.1 aminopeptidase P family protein [Bacteroidales bacterium]
MFEKEVYIKRRQRLKSLVNDGIALFIGNVEAPMNYPDNTYHWRQDSDFLYFFGIDLPGLAGVIDFNSGDEIIFGNDFTVDDIVWMGPQPSIAELASRAGVVLTHPMNKLDEMVHDALKAGRPIHFLPPYRAETKMTLGALLKENPCQMRTKASEKLIKAVVSLRSIKEDIEIVEIEKAIDITCEMETTAMRMCKPGVTEQEIFGVLQGIAYSRGAGPSFPIILSINGQTLHNHVHINVLREGRMMVTDCGAESNMHYAADLTRTTPVGGKFSQRQKEIYEIVLKANTESIKNAGPGISNRDLHLGAWRIIAEGMKDMGFMKGDIDEAVAAGAPALFMPHGLGHMMGLDVHDMESLGEDYVGYNDEVKRSNQFGLRSLRFALPYKPGHVFTVEPGIYFIPELVAKWKAEGINEAFINFAKVESYLDFGGIRIEDDVLITPTGSRLLGKPAPKTVEEIERTCI